MWVSNCAELSCYVVPQQYFTCILCLSTAFLQIFLFLMYLEGHIVRLSMRSFIHISLSLSLFLPQTLSADTGVHSFCLTNQILPRSPWANHLAAVKFWNRSLGCCQLSSRCEIETTLLHPIHITSGSQGSSSSPAPHHIHPDLQPFSSSLHHHHHHHHQYLEPIRWIFLSSHGITNR